MRKILDQFTEIWAIPLVCIMFFVSPYIITYIDPTAATWDWGVVQSIIPATIIVLGINLTAFLGFKFNFPELYKSYIDLQINELSQWQKLKAILFVVLLYSLEFVVVLDNLM